MLLCCCCVVVCCCAQPLKTQTLNLAWESGPALPTCSGFGVVVLGCCGCCWFGLPWTTFRRTPPPRTPLRRTAQNFALFLPFSATVSLFLCLSGCLLVEFWWCFERRNPEMCTFGLSGCRVKPRRPGLVEKVLKSLKSLQSFKSFKSSKRFKSNPSKTLRGVFGFQFFNFVFLPKTKKIETKR